MLGQYAASSPRNSFTADSDTHAEDLPSSLGANLLTAPAESGSAFESKALLHRQQRRRLLLGAYGVLFTRYCIATFLSSFFTPVATKHGISGSANGLIFAAYPLGMAATSVFAPQAIRWMGTRTAVLVGLAATSLFTLAFGLAPDAVAWSAPHSVGGGALQYVFMLAYFANGLLGALAETACIILVSAKYREAPATVMASINTVCTLGCMLGPVVGGVLYDIPSDPAWSFRLPFVACSAVPLLVLPFVPCFMPQEHISDAGEANPPAPPATRLAEAEADSINAASSQPPPPPPPPPPRAPRLCTLSISVGLVSIALSGTVVATLDPTLSIRLAAPPFECSASTISLFFFFSSVVYVCTSTPTGWLVDRIAPSSAAYKGITAAGFAVLGASFFILGPASPAALGLPAPPGLQAALNSLPAAALALGLKGVGSALSNCAIYPDLVLGLPTDAMTSATVSALWNAAYAVGWAAGPAVGGWLYDALAANKLCVQWGHANRTCAPGAGNATRPHPPPPLLAAPPPSPLSPSPPSPPACHCTWVADNGFDGFATTITAGCLAYAALLLLVVLASARTARAATGGWQEAPESSGAAGGAPGEAPPQEQPALQPLRAPPASGLGRYTDTDTDT